MDAEQSQVLSRAAYDRLHAELEQLKTEGRQGVAERLLRARELGDLSENAEYDESKNEQGMLEARIRNLEGVLKHAVVQDGPIESDTVVPGMLVVVRDGDGDETTFLLAPLKEERATGARTITPKSPLGRAVMGKGVGDKASYQAPGGTFTVEIVGLKSWDGQ